MTPAASPPLAPDRHRRLIRRLLLAVVAGFAFAFALVPLYDALCRVTGFNGKIGGSGFVKGGLNVENAPVSRVDRTRLVRVEFTGTVMPGLPWEMRPLQFSIDLHPGELQQVSYLVHNTADHPVTGQAVPSISPGQAARYFEKIECFCFEQQTLGPGETREMPLAFIVKPELAGDIAQITLSYAFYSLDGQRKTLTRSMEAR